MLKKSLYTPRIAVCGKQLANDSAHKDDTYSTSVKAMVKLLRERGAEPIQIDVTKDDPRLIGSFDALVLMGNDYDIDPQDYGAKPEPETKSELVPDAARGPKEMELALARHAYETDALQVARAAGLPVLGICGGMQRMQVAGGGSLNQHISDHDQRTAGRAESDAGSDVTIKPYTRLHGLAHSKSPTHKQRSILKTIFNSSMFTEAGIKANSIHHQAVQEPLARGFRIAAYAKDASGYPIIKAIESNNPKRWYAIGIQWHPEFLPEHDFTMNLTDDFVQHAREFAGRRPGQKHALAFATNTTASIDSASL